MKKKLLLILSICLVVAIVFTLASCGEKNADPTETPSQTDDGNGTNTGNNGNTDNGTDNGGTNTPSGNNNGSATVRTTTLPTRAAILSAIGAKYKVTAANTLGDSTTSASDGTYFYASDGSGVLKKLIGEYTYAYGDFRNGKYHKLSTPASSQDGTAYTVLGRGIVGCILQYAGETVRYQTVTDTTEILNRPAKKYVFTSDNANGYNVAYTETFVIDNATGACLMCNAQGTATDGFAGGTQKSTFSVTEFEYGDNNAAVRTCIGEQTQKIDVYEWDTAYLTQAGLSSVAAPAWQLDFSEWEGRTARDDDYSEWQVNYKYYTDDAAGTVNSVRAFIQSLYAAGANCNEYGAQATFDDLCYYEEDDKAFSFSDVLVAGNTGYVVTVYASYQKNIIPKHWLVEITVELPE